MLKRLKNTIGRPFGRDVYLHDGLLVGDLVALGDFPRVREYGIIVSRREYKTEGRKKLEYRRAIPVLTPRGEYTFSFTAIRIDPTTEIESINQDYESRINRPSSEENKEARIRSLKKERDRLVTFIQHHSNKTSNT